MSDVAAFIEMTEVAADVAAFLADDTTDVLSAAKAADSRVRIDVFAMPCLVWDDRIKRLPAPQIFNS